MRAKDQHVGKCIPPEASLGSSRAPFAGAPSTGAHRHRLPSQLGSLRGVSGDVRVESKGHPPQLLGSSCCLRPPRRNVVTLQSSGPLGACLGVDLMVTWTYRLTRGGCGGVYRWREATDAAARKWDTPGPLYLPLYYQHVPIGSVILERMVGYNRCRIEGYVYERATPS